MIARCENPFKPTYLSTCGSQRIIAAYRIDAYRINFHSPHGTSGSTSGQTA